tara:strand:- start:53 stop:937 length:885 start_codon:yes stop_codon:yes gene_type:complete
MDFKNFTNNSHNDLLKKQGYVIVNLFNKDIIEKLKLCYVKQTPKENLNSYTTFEIYNPDIRSAIDNNIKSFFSQSLKNVLNDHQLVWGNFMVKAPKAQNMELHADWSYVDEFKFVSMNVWAPLQDTNIKNGTLWVVPNSHKVIKSIRGINLPQYYFKQNDLFKKKYGIPINLKAGQAIIYDHRLIHYSYPNFSSKKRIAATLIVAPSKAELIHYWMNNHTKKIEKHLIKDPTFFSTNSFTEKPKTVPLDFIDSNVIRNISESDIETHLYKRGMLKTRILNYQLSKFKKKVNFPI